MNRQIKFRGKSLNTGAWVYGDLQHKGKRTFVEYEVAPETVGQYTGMNDKHGEYIYEGDIVLCKFGYCGNPRMFAHEDKVVVKWGRAAYDSLNSSDIYEYEIIGNIYDNPELLKPNENE